MPACVPLLTEMWKSVSAVFESLNLGFVVLTAPSYATRAEQVSLKPHDHSATLETLCFSRLFKHIIEAAEVGILKHAADLGVDVLLEVFFAHLSKLLNFRL